MADGEYYVYLYRDPDTNDIRYVGKGKGNRVDEVVGDVFGSADLARLTAKLELRDKREVRAWFNKLAKRNVPPVIEIMPCTSEAEALAVEAGLISALWAQGTLYNAVHGHKREFGPLGLPRALARRRYDPPVTRAELAALGGAIVVYIGAKSFFEGDRRHGSAPRLSLSDVARQRERDQTHRRIRRWWQVGPYVDHWANDPTSAPRYLLGVTGTVSQRWVWGALMLDAKKWNTAERQAGGLYELPTRSVAMVSEKDLDAKKLRGRRVLPGEVGPIERDGGRVFGGIPSQFFDVINPQS